MLDIDVFLSYLVLKAEMLSAGSRTEVTRVTERGIVRTITAGALVSPPYFWQLLIVYVRTTHT